MKDIKLISVVAIISLLLGFIFGILFGYNLGFDHGWEKAAKYLNVGKK